MKAAIKWLGIILALAMVFIAAPVNRVFADTVIPVYVLDPSWGAVGGGGVFSAYIGPATYDFVSPGSVGLFDGREAGIIKAGLAVDPSSGKYEDEGIFGFIPNVTIDSFAASAVSYDFETQAGVNPVWMTIEIDTGVVGVRSDNVTYQHVPTTNPNGWHTVDAVVGLWQKWNNNEGDVTGNPKISLGTVASDNPGMNVVRAYLRLGMGDSYNNNGTGTIAWVDKVTLAGTTYDFQVQNWYVSTTGSDTGLGTASSPFATIQHAIDVSTAGDTVNVTAGTYLLASEININKDITLNGIGNPLLQVSGTGSRLKFQSPAADGATLQGFQIEKTDKTGDQNIIYVAANNLTIQNNKIWGKYVIGDGEISRAMVFTGGLSGLNITNNEIFDLRQPAYISGVDTGTISNNFVYRTKGWVIEGGNLTFIDNTWGTGSNANVYDIAILSQVGPSFYTDVLDLSAANNNAIIEDQRTSPALLSSVYVDGSVAVSGVGTAQSPDKTIQEGIDRVIPGGNVYVAVGTYSEAVSITKSLHMIGANNSATIIKAPATLPGASDINSAIISVVGSGVSAEINGFTIIGFASSNPVLTGCGGVGSIGYGIFVRGGAYANIHDNKILDIHDNVSPLSGCQNGNAIQVGRNFFGTTGTATITNNVISGYQKTGIVVDNAGSNAVISGNTITGIGTTSFIAQNGIQISRGATANLTGNTVAGNSYHNTSNPSEDWGSTGILLWTSGAVSLTGGNNLSGNDNNLYIESPTGTVTVGAETFGPVTAPLAKGYQVVNNSTYPLELTSVTMEDVNFGTATPEQILPFAGRIYDGLDDPTLGVATLKANFWFVDQEGTIQAAINKAAPGDTVIVGEGTYKENLTISKALTLKGSANLATHVIGQIGITSSNVTIDGLDLSNPNQPYGILITGAPSNISVRNSKIHDIGSTTTTVNVKGIYFPGGADNILIENNTFDSISSQSYSAQAINSGDSTSTNGNVGVIIRNNTFSNIVSGLKGAYGIILNNGAGATGVVIDNNAFSNLTGKWTHAIGLEGPTAGARVVNNTFSALAANPASPDNAAIFFEANPVGATVVVNYNKFNGTNGVLIHPTDISTFNYTVDASKNWWSTIVKSVIQTKIYGSVVFEPYYLEEAMLNLSGPINTVYVDPSFTLTSCDGHLCGYDAFAKIQDGINAVASGGTVNVAAGTYTEVGQIVINKDVSIVGADKATTILKPDADYINWILVEAGKTFNLSNMTLDADGKLIRAAIRTKGSGSIENNIFKNVFYKVYEGWGIAIDYSAPNQIWNISNNTFENIQRVGILVDGQSNQATLTGNSFIGKGSGDWVNYGIEVGDGALATITGNSFESYKGIASTDGSTSAGILVTSYFGPNPSATINGNTFTNNSYGISLGYLDATHVVDTSSATASGNTFSNNNIAIDAVNSSIINIAASLIGNTFDRAVTVTHTSALLPSIFGKIQLAIDAASAGDSVNVAAGSYAENVIVNKSVEIAGAAQESTIVMPAMSNPNCGSGSLCANASNVFLVQANDVKIHDLTIDGDNPSLTSSYNFGGANLDARNGIITNHNLGVFNNLEVANVTVKNIYLRGIYASSAGSFNFHDNTVTNVQAEYASIAIFAYGGPGIMANNTVSYANDGISANHSKGIQFLNNIVSNSGSGIHTDNSGDGGGVADIISGNSVSSCVESAGGYGIWTFVNYLPVSVTGNTVTGCTLPYSVWGSANTTTVQFSNNTATAPSSNAGSVGIYVTTSEAGFGYADVYANFTNNILSGFETGIQLSADETSWDPKPYVAKTINSTFLHNQITGSTSMAAERGTTGTYLINLEKNWWGSILGPQQPVNQALDFTPWCGDAACTFYVPDADGNVTLSGTVNQPGGFNIYAPRLTITLADGTVVQNDNASCFDIHANYTTIQAETIGGAKCIPAAGKNGINVDSDLKNIVIDNIEFLGPAGTDGIHFKGAVTDVQVVDNWIHDLTGNGIRFLGQPTGFISIQGNLFQNNTGKGIEAGSFSIPAKFNSWGSINGAVAGDGKSVNVDSDPFTHMDLYVKSTTAAPVGGQVTYTVYGNLKNVTGASFTLKYPTSALTFSKATNVSSFVAAGAQDITVDQTAGTITFDGMVRLGTPALSGANMPIFTIVFTQKAGEGVMDLMETTDQFSMFPTIEPAPSNNIFAAALVDGYNTSGGFTVTGTVTMQGRPSTKSGVQATLAGLLYNFYAVSNNNLSNNLAFSVAAGTYTFTTNQPRYLNVTADLGKTVVVTANRSLPTLQLRGGNANNDSIIDIRDASIIGNNYLQTTFEQNADVNFDGIVDIRDISLMGGNYLLTSGEAYASWLP